MLTLGPLAFAAPWLLLALAALPLIWLLLRLTPPAPRRQIFPALRLLLGLPDPPPTAAHTPWWLTALRLLLATLVILALARPLLNPQAAWPGSGPVILVIDDGWAAAPRWTERQEQALSLLDRAERQGRAALLLTTAPAEDGAPPQIIGPRRAADLRSAVRSLIPKPWPTDRTAALTALRGLERDSTAPAFWLMDGLDDAAIPAFAELLQQGGGLTVLRPTAPDLPVLILPPEHRADGIQIPLRRLQAGGAQTLAIRAEAADGRLLMRAEVSFSAGQRDATQTLALPVELRNAVTRLRLENQEHVGAIRLIDDGFRRQPVGIVGAGTLNADRSLLHDAFYLDRALGPFAELRRGSVTDLLIAPPAAILLSDDEPISEEDRRRLDRFVQVGGALVRFAGPVLAGQETASALLPVRLRHGGRELGTALQWSEPQRLAEFDAQSPLAGIPVPEDVVVRRQVLAEPSPELTRQSWARLADGTPLVTADRHGQGWLVLVHVPASADWSNLPLSGAFVEMLRRFAHLGAGQSAEGPHPPLPPDRVLDGFGRLQPAPASVQPLAYPPPLPGPGHPPGYYGETGSLRALNLLPGPAGVARALEQLPAGVVERPLTPDREADLMPFLWLAALVLFLIDHAIALVMRGGGPGRRLTPLALVGLLLILPNLADGRDADSFAKLATEDTRLAAVLTGDDDADRTALEGLRALSQALSLRTTIEPLEPLAIDITQDELSFFPLLYWPVTDTQPAPSPDSAEKLKRYLRQGGTIVFDSRDGDSRAFSPGGLGSRTQALRRLIGGLDLPPLMRLPRDHVLARSFYLMSAFPGRHSEGDVWIQATDNGGDEVAAVIIGANDYAGAWAGGRTGIADQRQRELALRFGINLVMYALTGNYKSDQVHVPAILERLGQ